MDRVSIFIDGSNLYHGLKGEVGRTDLDFSLFIQRLVDGRRLPAIHSAIRNLPVPSLEPFGPQSAIESFPYFHLSLRPLPVGLARRRVRRGGRSPWLGLRLRRGRLR